MSATDEIFDLITAATSERVAGRIYLGDPPKNYSYVGPYIVFGGVGGQSQEDLTGGIGLMEERFQFSCRAKVDDGGNTMCRAIAEEIRIALQGIAPQDDAVLCDASHESAIDLYDYDLDIHVRVTDFTVIYSEQSTQAA